ncbi:hypothetical protein FVEG_03364 [Fusarium verticillioides 7600]|uniref:Uncharacterized protein n=1 Tax=Gibberella moniliformis (strain M3125 / FGSC 7600) TaxID=334819 RepID=W7M127_GIBM7|nr:hypothetical protein FVEG_03364 [Fusarium verticillioides 7600]EWG41214.1 hypothetical protein FVEG_03364 [Fusarium verticillioides 7600]
MPWEVLFMLEEQRGFARLQLADILIRGANLGSCGSCELKARYTDAYMSKLILEDLWPAYFSKMPISMALQRVEMMSDRVPRGQSHPCDRAHYHNVPLYRICRKNDIG